MVVLSFHRNSLRPRTGDPPNFLRFTKVTFSSQFASSCKSGSTEKESGNLLNQPGQRHLEDMYLKTVKQKDRTSKQVQILPLLQATHPQAKKSTISLSFLSVPSFSLWVQLLIHKVMQLDQLITKISSTCKKSKFLLKQNRHLIEGCLSRAL